MTPPSLSSLLDTCTNSDIDRVVICLDDGCGRNYLDDCELHFLVTGSDDAKLRQALHDADYEVKWRGDVWDAHIGYSTEAPGEAATVYTEQDGVNVKPLKNQLAYDEYHATPTDPR